MSVLFSFVIATTGSAISNIEIPATTDWSVNLVEELEVLPDEGKIWTFQRILQTPELRFTQNINEKPILHTYWARLILSNRQTRDEIITFQSNYWDHVSIYLYDSNGHTEQLNIGILSLNYQPEIKIAARSELHILAKFEASGKFRRENNINLVISKTISKLTRMEFQNYMDGIIFGIMFGLAFYNLFIYISLRDPTYLWYTLYTILYAAAFISLFVDSPPKLTSYFLLDLPSIAFYLKK
ncbi:MAG: hypothetical protein IPL46_18550 [Saprospiraceae bacterium]|nr:hypothetical protein [Saprospiraceae bacterium]